MANIHLTYMVQTTDLSRDTDKRNLLVIKIFINDSALIGTSARAECFKEVTETKNESFAWSTNGNMLTLIINGVTDISTYSIYDDTLSIADEAELTTILARQ
jgi:hypothetical protein